jgi:hypothetical protein
LLLHPLHHCRSGGGHMALPLLLALLLLLLLGMRLSHDAGQHATGRASVRRDADACDSTRSMITARWSGKVFSTLSVKLIPVTASTHYRSCNHPA